MLSTTETVSSSSTVTARSDETPPYSPPEPVCTRVATSLASASGPAFTVTVCASSQVEVVKVRVFPSPRPVSSRSVSSWPVTVTVTSTDGSWDSFTV